MTSGWSWLPLGSGLLCEAGWGPSSSLPLLYLISRSFLDSPSRFQISSFVRAFYLRSFLSKQYFVKFLYVRFLCDVFVVMFDTSVFSFLPKCGSNGEFFVVVLDIRRLFSIMFVGLLASVVFDQMGLMSITANLLFLLVLAVRPWRYLCDHQLVRVLTLYFLFAKFVKFFCFKCLCLITSDRAWYSV